MMDRKYEELIESYRRFATEDKHLSPEKKVKNTIKELAKKLQEIEILVNYNTRLKTESGVSSSAYGSSTQKALTKISEKLIKISERVRALGE
jgi:ABC-type taurine transport system substrate-binding protein